MVTEHDNMIIVQNAVSTRRVKLALYHDGLKFSSSCSFDNISFANFSKQAHHRLDALLQAMESSTEADSVAKDDKGEAV